MHRQTVEVAVVAVLCVLALSVAAATLDTATAPGGSPGGSGFGDGNGGASNETASPTPAADSSRPLPIDEDSVLLQWLAAALCVPLLTEPEVVLGVAALVAGGALLVKRRYGTARVVSAAVLVGVPALSLSIPVLFTLDGCEPGGGRDADGGSHVGGEFLDTSAWGGGDATQVMPESSALLVAVLGVAVAAGVAVLVLGTDDDDPEPTEETGEDGDGTGPADRATSRIARSAGAAADRIEGSGDLENEVFRAWREMTTHLAVDRPDSSTPAEFRAAAVEAGMAPDHVSELTALFEDVRYGGYEATTERERRAVEALRRIEAAYGEGSG